MKKNITIPDLGYSNLGSVQRMIEKIGFVPNVSSDYHDLSKSDCIILAGVGSFDYAMSKIQESNWYEEICEQVLIKKKVILGICLGMQLLCNSSEEGSKKGFGFIDADVKKFNSNQNNIRIPHMGWSYINGLKENNPFNWFENEQRFYFAHSYFAKCKDKKNVLAEAKYGINFHASINKENIFGVQFHPEKSHKYGIDFFEKFFSLVL